MSTVAGSGYNPSYHDGVIHGYNQAKRELEELFDELYKLHGQINYKYIIVTQEEYDRIKETGKLVD